MSVIGRVWILGVLFPTALACSGKREDPVPVRMPPPARNEELNVRYVPLAPAGTAPQKVVVFPREGDDWKDMTASAWEFDPEKPEAGFVRRAEFAKSHWNATLLFQSTKDAPEFVRLQVNGPTDLGYVVHFYHLNYRTWEVKLLLKTDQVVEMGANEKSIFIDTDKGRRVVDRSTLEIRPPEPDFRVLGRFDPTWLVELQDGRGALFDLPSGRLKAERFKIPENWKFRGTVPNLSPDGRRVASWDRFYRGDPESRNVKYGQSIMLTGSLEIHDLASGKRGTLEFLARCSGGSGNPIITGGPCAEWKDGGKSMTYRSRTGKALNSGLEQITVDAETLAMKSREPVGSDRMPLPPDVVPWFLKADYEALEGRSTEGGRRTALAFLRRHQVDVGDVKNHPDSSVCFSPDGLRFILRINPPSRLAGQDYYCGDLSANTLRRIPAPAALALVPLDMEWVPIPPERR